MEPVENIIADDLSKLDFDYVETLCIVDAVDNVANDPLYCDKPPHRISDEMGCKDHSEYVADRGATPAFDLNLPTPT